jgi:hypothetical protein
MRFFLTLALVLFVFVVPHVAQAGGIPFWGPIIAKEWQNCALGWGAVINVINNIISFMLTFAIVFVLPIVIAYAGFMYVINPISAEGRSDAKRVAWNAVVGIVLALAAWMIVDAVMAVLYNPTKWTKHWKELIVNNGGIPVCLFDQIHKEDVTKTKP